VYWCIGHRHVEKVKRRREVNIEAEAAKIHEVAHSFNKEKLKLDKRIYSMRVFQKFSVIKKLAICSRNINENFTIICEE